MAQMVFDHTFNTLSDSTYAVRCRQKRKLRQRKSPKGDFQIYEDVWAPHPTDQLLYIASIDTINRFRKTCRVTFVDDGLSCELPTNSLRHVTRKDIENDHYVDYGHGWSEISGPHGAIYTYNRYGEISSISYGGYEDGTSDDEMLHRTNYIDTHVSNSQNMVHTSNFKISPEDNNIDTQASISNVENAESSSRYIELLKNLVFVKIPDPENPTKTWLNFPVWHTTSYTEAEEYAFACINEDFDYLKAVERARNQANPSQSAVPTSEEAAIPVAHESFQNQNHSIEIDSVTESNDSKTVPVVQEAAVQTESIISLPNNCNHSTDTRIPLEILKKLSYSSVYTSWNRTSHFKRNKSSTRQYVKRTCTLNYTFLMILLMIYCLLSSSTSTNQRIQTSSFKIRNTLLPGHILVLFLLEIFLSTSIFFTSLNRPALKLWPYPFAVP